MKNSSDKSSIVHKSIIYEISSIVREMLSSFKKLLSDYATPEIDNDYLKIILYRNIIIHIKHFSFYCNNILQLLKERNKGKTKLANSIIFASSCKIFCTQARETSHSTCGKIYAQPFYLNCYTSQSFFLP